MHRHIKLIRHNPPAHRFLQNKTALNHKIKHPIIKHPKQPVLTLNINKTILSSNITLKKITLILEIKQLQIKTRILIKNQKTIKKNIALSYIMVNI
jgi:hypothetical protein